MRLLVTGASGFIGRNLLLSLPKKWEATAVYHRSRNFLSFLKKKDLRKVQPLRCDLSSVNALRHKRLLTQGTFDACIYLAANSDPTLSVRSPERDFRMTAMTVLNFLSYVKVKKLVYVSSGAVYDGRRGLVSPQTPLKPHLPYAISHLIAERTVQSFCAQRKNPGEYLIIRFFGAYGPYEPPRKITTKLVKAFSNGRCRAFSIRGNGRNLIDAMYVSDATEAFLRALRTPLKNRTFDLCSGSPLSIETLTRKVAAHFGCDQIKIRKRGPTAEPIHFRASTRFQKEKLHFTPKVSLEAGLRRFAAFLKKENR